ncbi:hypothetical protein phi16_gp046 [Corynebacterium phage phi16]|uniref:hypothetical protein n=1 Tax=Corynebacterium glutamicum TaxID=1718 RepID=UPI0009444E7F|nr:hypothetical protein [Corynebacterium glutamicum]APQ42549.1 hypothetical protein phi16_gp046 [Corynebacterium phage phi16]OKX80546.1 hypothetical protein AUO95_10395 [Corynebacterium glutamicum]
MKLLKKWTHEEVLECMILGKTAVRAAGHSENLHLIAITNGGILVKSESKSMPVDVMMHQILGIDYE